jgi:hypothetical protein
VILHHDVYHFAVGVGAVIEILDATCADVLIENFNFAVFGGCVQGKLDVEFLLLDELISFFHIFIGKMVDADVLLFWHFHLNDLFDRRQRGQLIAQHAHLFLLQLLLLDGHDV